MEVVSFIDDFNDKIEVSYFFEHLTYVHFRSLLWLGPALLFSTATAISVLGWDGIVRTILSVSMPYAGTYLFVLWMVSPFAVIVWCSQKSIYAIIATLACTIIFLLIGITLSVQFWLVLWMIDCCLLTQRMLIPDKRKVLRLRAVLLDSLNLFLLDLPQCNKLLSRSLICQKYCTK